jgi:hypothetical protein
MQGIIRRKSRWCQWHFNEYCALKVKQYQRAPEDSPFSFSVLKTGGCRIFPEDCLADSLTLGQLCSYNETYSTLKIE